MSFRLLLEIVFLISTLSVLELILRTETHEYEF